MHFVSLCRIKWNMGLRKFSLAATELLLILPATLFMAALFLRNVQPQQYEPAHTAQQIVMWYSARPQIGLSAFLVALPLTVLGTGCIILFRSWTHDVALRTAVHDTLATLRAHLATAIVAVTTLVAGGVLAIVALHVITD